MDRGPLTAVRHDLIEIGLVDDDNTSAELDLGMLRVFTDDLAADPAPSRSPRECGCNPPVSSDNHASLQAAGPRQPGR